MIYCILVDVAVSNISEDDFTGISFPFLGDIRSNATGKYIYLIHKKTFQNIYTLCTIFS